MKRSSKTHAPAGYPSILDLALKAGKWSFLAGSSALIMGTTACGPIPMMGAVDLDGYELDAGRDVAPDPGWMGDDTHVADPGGEVANDVQVVDEGADWGPTAGVPYQEDGWDQDTSVQDTAGDPDVVSDEGTFPIDAVVVDPGMPLPGEPMPDIFESTDADDIQQ